MKNLSKREKVLLYVLALVMIFSFSLYYLIIPSIEKLDDVKIQLEETKLLKLEMSEKLQSIENKRNNITKTNQEINSISSEFLPLMENNEIESLITGILVNHNMAPEKLLISDSQEAVSVSDEPGLSYVTKRYISTKMNGTFADLKEVIGDIDERGSLRISAFTTDGNLEQNIDISIDFEVFMYDNPQK